MTSSQVEVEGIDMQLKHVGFLRTLTINAVVLVSNVYDYAKQNSGSLKSTVDTVENAVTTVAAPVYERFKGVPSDFLIFLDRKVNEATNKSPAAKSVVSKAQILVEKASQAAQDLAEEAKVGGPLAAVSHASMISKHFAVSQLAVAWYKVNEHPSLHGVSEMAIPTATHLSEKYNNLVKALTMKGYTFFNYVPLVPVQEMAKAYKQVGVAAGKKMDTASLSESDSDRE